MLELIAVPFKRKIAWVFLQELFGRRITLCLIEQSSLGVIFRGRPDLFLSRNVPSELNITIVLCIAVLDHRNLAAMPLSVYPYPCKVIICALRISDKDDFFPLP